MLLMRSKHVILTSLFLIAVTLIVWLGVTGCIAKSTINHLIGELDQSRVSRIKIFWENLNVESESRISAEAFKEMEFDPQIRNDPFFEHLLHTTNIDDPSTITISSDLSNLLKNLSIFPEPPFVADIRLSVSFYDLNGTEITTLYFTRDGTHGAVDSHYVSFRGALFDWLGRHYIDPQ